MRADPNPIPSGSDIRENIHYGVNVFLELGVFTYKEN